MEYNGEEVFGVVKWEVLDPEELSLGTGIVQCKHKNAILKRIWWQVALEVFGLQSFGTGWSSQLFKLFLLPPPLMDQVMAAWSDLVGLCCSCRQISEGFEEVLHLLLEEDVSVLCIFICSLWIPESDLQHVELLLLLVQLLLEAVYLGLVLRAGLLQPQGKDKRKKRL